VRTRTRTCTNPAPSCGGADCGGEPSIQIPCHKVPCEKNCSVPSDEFFAERVGIGLTRENIVDKAPTGVLPSGEVYFVHGVSVPYTCQSGFKYVDNSSTSPSVDCNDGVWYGGKECTDVDECADDIHGCDPLKTTCANTVGSYSCPCQDGYQVDVVSGECKDIDECMGSPPPCDQLCRNDKGSYHCYCKDTYVYNETTLTCEKKLKECSPLPDLSNGIISCTDVGLGQQCDLTCNTGFDLISDLKDATPQLCLEGEWIYQKAKLPFPTCEEQFDLWLDDSFFVTTPSPCDVGATFDDFVADPPEDLTVDSVGCEPVSGGKRAAVGRIVVRLVMHKQLNASCGRDCIEEESRMNKKSIFSKITTEGFGVQIRTGNTTVELDFSSVNRSQISHEKTSRFCGEGKSLINGICSVCPAGYVYNATGEVCEPCGLGTYKERAGSGVCAPCGEGLYTRTRGAVVCEEQCPSGTYSKDGFPPCVSCPKGTYQDKKGADFCYQCDFEWTTDREGSTSPDSCGCPAGQFGQGCTRTCSCVSGGHCTADGCVCPRGWRGMNCTVQETCTGVYYVSFSDNYRRRNARKLHLVSGNSAVTASVLVLYERRQPDQLMFNLKANNFTTIELPSHEQVVAEVKVSPDTSAEVIGFNEEFASVDAFASFPVAMVTPQEYIVISMATNPHYFGQFDSFVQIIGSHDNTSVEIKPLVDASVQFEGRTDRIRRGTNYQATLAGKQKILVTSGGDLTGTEIATSHGVAVYSGHECALVPVSSLRSGCDHLVEQMPPTSLWGTEYILTPFLDRRKGSYIKMVSSKPDTTVNIQCISGQGTQDTSDVVVLGERESYNFSLKVDSFCRVVSNHPILVAQFSEGDNGEGYGAPFMVLIPDTRKLLGNISFISADTSDHKLHHLITIIIDGVSELTSPLFLDDRELVLDNVVHDVVEFGSRRKFMVIRMSVKQGYHYLEHSMYGQVFGVIVYGFSRVASYGYSMGYHQGTRCNQ
jgi:hypothetical protein